MALLQSEELAINILKQVDFVSLSKKTSQLVRTMEFDGKEHPIAMRLNIKVRETMVSKPIGGLGERFSGVLAQALRVYGVGIDEFIEAGHALTVGLEENEAVPAMHVLMKAMNQGSDSTSRVNPESEPETAQGQRPVLTLIQGGGS
jgi:hypothetical protein